MSTPIQACARRSFSADAPCFSNSASSYPQNLGASTQLGHGGRANTHRRHALQQLVQDHGQGSDLGALTIALETLRPLGLKPEPRQILHGAPGAATCGLQLLFYDSIGGTGRSHRSGVSVPNYPSSLSLLCLCLFE